MVFRTVVEFPCYEVQSLPTLDSVRVATDVARLDLHDPGTCVPPLFSGSKLVSHLIPFLVSQISYWADEYVTLHTPTHRVRGRTRCVLNSTSLPLLDAFLSKEKVI